MADKYNADQLKTLKAAGKTFPGTTSYPIADKDDLDRAIHAVGRGNADHDAVRSYIIGRAKVMGLSSMIPDNWSASGSLKSAKSRDVGGLETRMFASADFRVSDDANGLKAAGYATTLDPYWVGDGGPGGGFTEQLLPGAFRNVVKSSDCILQLNHAGIALARVPTTLTLSEDQRGLRWEAVLDGRSAAHSDLLVALERGDIRACSFGFRLKSGDDEWGGTPTQQTRKIRNVSELFDVSCVNAPCNPGTSVSLEGRSIYAVGPVDRTNARSHRMTTSDLRRQVEEDKRRWAQREKRGQISDQLRRIREEQENAAIVAQIRKQRQREADLEAVKEISAYTPTIRPRKGR